MLWATEKTSCVFILKFLEVTAFKGHNFTYNDVHEQGFVLAAKKD
jgi:hypothetical protein